MLNFHLLFHYYYNLFILGSVKYISLFILFGVFSRDEHIVFEEKTEEFKYFILGILFGNLLYFIWDNIFELSDVMFDELFEFFTLRVLYVFLFL